MTDAAANFSSARSASSGGSSPIVRTTTPVIAGIFASRSAISSTGVVVRTMGDDPPLLALRADEKFAAASVIKLAILATVYRAYDAGTAKPSDTVKTRGADLIGGSDVLAGARAGSAWTLDALVNAMIRVSDNAASNTLITAF